MKERVLTCIVCPRGCTVKVSFDGEGKIAAIDGYSCPRGKVYAEQECTHPERTVTSTVRTVRGDVIACKTARTVPKETVFRVMQQINRTRVALPVHIGDVLISDVAGTGVAVVATENRE